VLGQSRQWRRLALEESEFPYFVQSSGGGGVLVVSQTSETGGLWVARYGAVVLGAQGEIGSRRDLPEGISDATRIGRKTALLGTRGVFYLDETGGLRPGPARQEREVQLLPGVAEGLILCRKIPGHPVAPFSGEKSSAGCRSTTGWSFDGVWFASQPLRCGSWLIEPVDSEDGRSRIGIKVRDLSSAQVVHEMSVAGGPLFCLPDQRLWDAGNRTVMSLPELRSAGRAHCGGGSAKAVLPVNGRVLCLNAQGRVLNLVVEADGDRTAR
jgi:hypothetical protein